MAENDVALALAGYDVAAGGHGRTAVYEIGDEVPLTGWGARIEAVAFEHTYQSTLRIVVKDVNKGKQQKTNGDLPTLLAPGETLGMRFVFPLTASDAPGAGASEGAAVDGARQPVQVKVGAGLYEVGRLEGD